jgi:hypothetical protein
VSTWKHSLLASYYGRDIKGECQVRIEETKIVGCATLHRIPGENLLEGHWIAGQVWRIHSGAGIWLPSIHRLAHGNLSKHQWPAFFDGRYQHFNCEQPFGPFVLCFRE